MSNDTPPPSSPPLDVIRQTLDEADIRYQDGGDLLMMGIALRHVEVQVFCSGEPDDLASIIVRLPIRATQERISAVSEFLHRLNWNARRKFWEIDVDSGEIRLGGYTDTIAGPLTGDLFQRLLDAMLTTADMTFPYLTSVLNARMNPEFAADQAEAALGS